MDIQVSPSHQFQIPPASNKCQHDEEEGDELMDVDGNKEEEEPTVENSDSGDDNDDSENSDESAGYANF